MPTKNATQARSRAKTKSPKVGLLTTSTFQGLVPGAKHWKGRLRLAGIETDVEYMPTRLQRIKLSSPDYIWPARVMCGRFFSLQTLRKTAIKLARDQGATWLFEGRFAICEPQPILYGDDPALMAELNKLYRTADRIGFWERDEAKMELVCKTWSKLTYAAGLTDRNGGIKH